MTVTADLAAILALPEESPVTQDHTVLGPLFLRVGFLQKGLA